MFAKGIEPAWEDPANEVGGRWQIRYGKHQPQISDKLWEDLVMGVVGEQFTYPDEINGIVISIKGNQDIISVWNKTGRDDNVVQSIKDDIVRILGIPYNAQMDYTQFNVDDDKKK